MCILLILASLRWGQWFSGEHDSVRLTVGFDDLRDLFQPSRFYDSHTSTPFATTSHRPPWFITQDGPELEELHSQPQVGGTLLQL